MKAKRDDGKHVLEGNVRDVTDGGDSVVETERGIVMVPGALPGERVRVRIHETRGGVARGTVLSWLSRAPDRIESVCGIAERCGGCPLISLAIGAQQQLKRDHVERAVSKVVAPGVSVEFEASPIPLGYRRRARFAFRKVGSGTLLGYHTHGSKQLVEVERCPVLEPVLDRALEQVRMALLSELSGSGEIELSSLDDQRALVSITCAAPVSPAAYRAAEALATRTPIVGVSVRVQEGAPALFGEHEATYFAADGLPVRAPQAGFSQVNARVNAHLTARVIEFAEPQSARVLELYAGHGNFTLGLSEHAAELLAVEGHQAAADACRENMRTRGREHARVLHADVRRLAVRGRWDVLVLDPPRGGCAELADIVTRAQPTRVVYVSCQMTTLSRDLRALQSAGYCADRVLALDMFPQTGHVEAVVRMRKVAS